MDGNALQGTTGSNSRSSERRTPRVIVIGGGLAGATAALALAEAGAAVTVIEAKSRLGGRVGSYIDRASGNAIDYCQHVGMGCCSNLKALIDRLGQRDLWRIERKLYFYGPTGQQQVLCALPLAPAPLHLSTWLVRWPGLTWSDRFQIGRAMLSLDRIRLPDRVRAHPDDALGDHSQDDHAQDDVPQDDDPQDNVSAAQWLRRRGQSPRALERFWATIVVSALGEELERVALPAMAKVFQDGFLRHRDAFHLLVPRRPLDELFGSRFAAALAQAGVDVLTGTGVAELLWRDDRCDGVRLDDGRILRADRFVIAVPWHSVNRLVGQSPLAAARKVGQRADRLTPSPISGVHTWWDRPWLATPHAVIVGRLCQWVFSQPEQNGPQDRTEFANSEHASSEHASSARAHAGHYYQIVISASRSLPRGDSEQIGRLIYEDLQAVFPAARQARLLRWKAVTDPQAVFSVAPGSARLRPAAGSHVGNLYWAGDWTRTGWPATMEGAVLSGLAAAEAIATAHRLASKFTTSR